MLSRHGRYRTTLWIFWGFRRMETAPTTIEVLLRPTLGQSDEPSDLRDFLNPTTQHRCSHVLVYTAPGSCLTSVIEPTPMSWCCISYIEASLRLRKSARESLDCLKAVLIQLLTVLDFILSKWLLGVTDYFLKDNCTERGATLKQPLKISWRVRTLLRELLKIN